jgi:hypothetical protein
MRYFADGVVTLKAIAAGLAQNDRKFKIDGGELIYDQAVLGEIEINATGSDLFAEDLGSHIAQLERVATAAAGQVIGRLGHTKSIVTLHVLDSERDPNATWELIGPLWSVLPALSTGLTQSDGQGFYDGARLVVAVP